MAKTAKTTKKETPAVAPEVHSMLSPSAAKRWLACPPSALLESGEPERSSKASETGSVAHECAARRLNGMAAKAADAEMERHVCAYVAYVNAQFEEARRADRLAMLAIETRVDLRPWIPNGFGTADAVVLANGTLQVIDLKYGDGVKVEAGENPQLMAYALGVLHLYDGLCYTVENVAMTIYQPRMDNISTYTLPAADLRRWGDEVLRPGALKAAKGEGELAKGGHCKFCKVKGRCRAWHADWDRLQELRARHLADDASVARVVREFKELEGWAKGLISDATAAALNGKVFEGLKLVEKRGMRRIVDPDGLAAALIENKAAAREDIYETTLRTITELERIAGKKTFAELSTPYVAFVPGAPALVDASAAGREYTPGQEAEKQFEALFDNH